MSTTRNHTAADYLRHIEVVAGSPSPEDLAAVAAALSIAERERHEWLEQRSRQLAPADPTWRQRERTARRDRQLY